MTIDVGAAILAGGAGRRMGGVVKALIEVEGVAILDRQLAVLRQLCTEIAIAGGDPAQLGGRGVPVLADAVPGAGPLAGIAAALAASRALHVLCVACDMPYLDPAVLRQLCAAAAPGVDAVVPIVDGRPLPVCTVYARSCLELILDRLDRGQRRASDVVADSRLRVVSIQFHAEPSFRNVNTPDDLR